MVPDLVVRALEPSTWLDFAALADRNNGVWGGCWCLAFHPEGNQRGTHRRALKEARVQAGTAHAALVYEGEVCIGWCQFGSPAELPRIKHRLEYQAGLDRLPDWRITCFFTDPGHRKEGVSARALEGALGLIAGLGGGVVESYPEEVAGRKVSSSFLHNGSLTAFEAQGFEKVRPLGKDHWVVRRTVTGTGKPGRA